MSYYHDLITEKSWQLLQIFKRNHQFILIGGWAVFLYTQGLKSKDIDIIVNYEELAQLKGEYNLYKNDRLKKYEIHQAEIDIDIYVPFFSELGIPVENIQNKWRIMTGFRLPEPEILLILKQTAWAERRHSLKGEKDKIDIIALLQKAVDIKKYRKLLDIYKLIQYQKQLQELLSSMRFVPELKLNEYQYSRLKNKLKAALSF